MRACALACACVCVHGRACKCACVHARTRACVCVRCSDRPQPSWACACVQERLSARRPCGARRRDDGTRRRRHARCFRWQCGARPSQAKPSRAKRGGGGAAAALLSLTSRSKLIPCGPSCTFRNAPTPCPVPAASTARPRAHADPCAVTTTPPVGRPARRGPAALPPGPTVRRCAGLVRFVCGARGGARAGFRAFGCGPLRTYRAGSRARPATAACARRRRAGSPSCPRGRPPCRRRCARAARASSTAAPATPASHARRQRAPSRRQAPLWMRPRSARRRAALPFPLLRPAPARSHIYLYKYIYIHPLQGCGLPARRGRRGGPTYPAHPSADGVRRRRCARAPSARRGAPCA